MNPNAEEEQETSEDEDEMGEDEEGMSSESDSDSEMCAYGGQGLHHCCLVSGEGRK